MSNTNTGEQQVYRLGAVSYLNARPLIHGLNANPNVSVASAVPARLPDMLHTAQVDAALIPTIDLARAGEALNIVSDACIACQSATLTVRVFSRVDPADITTLYVDGDSHTSVALASIIWQEKFNRRIKLVPFQASDLTSRDALQTTDAVLLIGDKVINPPTALETFSTQVDLGATWNSLTGLPFVFAVWVTANPDPADRLAAILSEARDAGVANAPQIAADFGPAAGWPVSLAEAYLCKNLTYTLGDPERQGMQRFFELARHYNLVSPTTEPVSA